MRKKVTLTPKTRMKAEQPPADPVDLFVQAGADSTPAPAGEATPMKRLTIDVSDDLHRRIKTRCAAEGVKMADVIRDLLEEHFT